MSDHDEAGTEPAGEGAPGPELRGDDFVARLVSDPKSPPQTTLISGYLGASDEEGHTRVYFDPELSDYVDVPNGDILHTEHPGEGPLAAALVWIKRDSQVLHGQAGAARQRAGFFEGRVWQDNFAATAVQGGPGGFPANNAMRTVDTCMPTDFCPTPVTSPVKCYRPFDFATPRINPTPYVRQPAFQQPAVQNRFAQGGPEIRPAQSVAICAVSAAAVCRPIRTLRVVECPTKIQAICRPIPRSPWCPPNTINTIPGGGPQWLQGSGGGTDTVLYGSGGGTDTVVYGSGGGTDTVLYGSGQGTDTVWYGSGGGTDTVVHGSTGGGTDTVFYGSGQGTDTVYYGSGGIADTVYYGSGGGADTVVYGSGGGGYVATIYQGGILPTRICPSAACGGFPRRPFRTQVGPCGFPTLGPRGCASAVDGCPTRFCPQQW